MKIKLKFLDSPSAVHRVDVQNNASLSELQHLVVTTLSLSTQPHELNFSLNKKDNLRDDQNLSQQGITSGDVLWVSGTIAPSISHANPPLVQVASLSTAAAAKAENTSVMRIDDLAPPSQSVALVPAASLTALNHVARMITEAQMNGASPSHYSMTLMAIHSTMLEAGFQMVEDRAKDIALIKSSKTWRASYHYVDGSDEDSAPTSSTPRQCQLVATLLGPNTLTLHASTLAPSPPPQASSPPSVKTIHLTLSNDNNISHQLIRTLKDQLSLHLLTRCFQEAGLVPPLGWPSLPREVQLKILTLLDSPKDLSAAARSCVEMWRLIYRSDHDEQMTLWAHHFSKEFGGVLPGEGELASSGGIRGAFVARWMRRKQIEEDRRRKTREASEHLRRRGPVLGPGVPFPGRGGYGPSGMMGPNNGVVGGDYDRFPLMGGLGGIGGLAAGRGRGLGGFHQHDLFQ